MAKATNAKYSDNEKECNVATKLPVVRSATDHFGAQALIYSDGAGIIGEKIFRDSIGEVLCTKAEQVHALVHVLALTDLTDLGSAADSIVHSFFELMSVTAEQTVALAKIVHAREMGVEVSNG